MNEISKKVRANIIIQLGSAINDEHSMNITEALVYELVQQLDPSNRILKDKHYVDIHKRAMKE